MSWHTAIVRDNRDPEQLARLRLEVPELYGAERVVPGWVRPRVPAAAPGAGWVWIPPVNAIVVVWREASTLTWQAGEYGQRAELPAVFLGEGYPQLSGLTSPAAAAALVFDDRPAGGVHVLAEEQRVIRLARTLAAATEALLLGETYLADHKPWIDAAVQFLTACSTATTAPQIAAAAVAALPAAIAYQGKVSASVSAGGAPHLSGVSRTQ